MFNRNPPGRPMFPQGGGGQAIGRALGGMGEGGGGGERFRQRLQQFRPQPRPMLPPPMGQPMQPRPDNYTGGSSTFNEALQRPDKPAMPTNTGIVPPQMGGSPPMQGQGQNNALAQALMQRRNMLPQMMR